MRPCGVFDTRYELDIAIIRTPLHWFLLCAFLALFFTVVPVVVPEYWLHIINLIGISIIAVLGLSILTGYCGQISLGQSAFMAVGAYVTAILGTTLNIPFWICIPVSGLCSGVIGLLFGLPSLRVRGFYLAMSTLAAQYIIIWIIIHGGQVTQGIHAFLISPPTLGNFAFTTENRIFYIIMVCAAALIYFSQNLIRSRVGRAFIAVRDNDLAAGILGINVFYYKLVAFFLSAFYAGIAGSLWCFFQQAISYEQFHLMQSIWYLGMIIVGGMGSTLGAIFGTVFLTMIDVLTRYFGPLAGQYFPFLGAGISSALGQGLFGITIMVFLIFEPRGLVHWWENIKTFFRLWPLAYRIS